MLKIADSICLFQYINMDFNLFLVCHFIIFLFIDFYLQCDEISQDIKIKIKTIISNKKNCVKLWTRQKIIAGTCISHEFSVIYLCENLMNFTALIFIY